MLPKEIKESLKQISNIPYVNAGGCGIVAHALYTALQKHELKAKPSIVYLFRSFDDRRIDIHYKEGGVVSPAHAMVKLGNKYYDCDGEYVDLKAIRRDWGRNLQLYKADPEKALQAVLNTGIWNDAFDRQHTADICKHLGVKNIYTQTKRNKIIKFISAIREKLNEVFFRKSRSNF